MGGFSNPFNFVKFLAIFISANYISLIFFKKARTFFNFDLLLRFTHFFSRNTKIVINFFKVQLSLFWSFLKDTSKNFRDFIHAVYVNIKPDFSKWRPLFKKTSYFGFFRTHRSKWFK